MMQRSHEERQYTQEMWNTEKSIIDELEKNGFVHVTGLEFRTRAGGMDTVSHNNEEIVLGAQGNIQYLFCCICVVTPQGFCFWKVSILSFIWEFFAKRKFYSNLIKKSDKDFTSCEDWDFTATTLQERRNDPFS